jgi:hypothetical protein
LIARAGFPCVIPSSANPEIPPPMPSIPRPPETSSSVAIAIAVNAGWREKGISHAGAKKNLRGVACEVRQTGVDLAVEPLIRQPHCIVTDCLSETRTLDHRLHRGISKHQ